MHDVRWRLRPRAQYGEAKHLAKMKKEGLWDGGRNLPLPPPPSPEADLDEIAADFSAQHGLENVGLVRDMLQRLVLAEDEASGNRAENARQQGQVIRYGDVVELEHVATGRVLTLTKFQACERAAKRIDVAPGGSDASLIILSPAFKAFSTGEPICSGHLLNLGYVRELAGAKYCLHVGHDHGQKVDDVLRRSLQLSGDLVVGCSEVNATTGGARPTAWRLVLFESYQSSPLNEDAFPELHAQLHGEQVVCFYHKEAESYLDYRPELGESPIFHASQRVSIKSRKKASWMWKIEALSLYRASRAVQSSETAFFRIKHTVSRQYLCQVGSRLEMTPDPRTPGTAFFFKNFDATDALSPFEEHFVDKNGLVYFRSATGEYIEQQDRDDERVGKTHIQPVYPIDAFLYFMTSDQRGLSCRLKKFGHDFRYVLE
jgi:hypothetical protein